MQKIIQPSLGYLFSYCWLAMEIIIFTLVIQYLLTTATKLILACFFLLFARFYYWLNFSPETKVQTIILLLLSCLYLCCYVAFPHISSLWIAINVAMILIVIGIIRIQCLRYILILPQNQLIIQLFWCKQVYEIDRSQPITFQQHSRGQLLNFGCICLPIKTTKPVKQENWYDKLLLTQRNPFYHQSASDCIALDGIADPLTVFRNLQNLLTNE